MNLFTVNQVNQVYVVNGVVTGSNVNPTNPGDVKVGKIDNSIYFKHMGPAGITRSDLIDLDKVLWAKVTPAAKMVTKLKKATVTLADSALADSKPIAGQDYVLRIAFTGYIGISPEDSQYWKYAVVHTYNGMTTSDFYKAMAISLRDNFKREGTELLKIALKTSGDDVPVEKNTAKDSLTGTYTGVILKEVEPDWILGLKGQKPLKFDVVPTEIDIVEGTTVNQVSWGNVAYSDGTTIQNGKLTADYEYFFHGERGDQYRMVSWPDYIPTEYLVDPNLTYDYVQIHFAYIGSNESCQKSEKDITLVCLPWVTNVLVSAINTKANGAFTLDSIPNNPTEAPSESNKVFLTYDLNQDGVVNTADVSMLWDAIINGSEDILVEVYNGLTDPGAKGKIKSIAIDKGIDTSGWD